jgi:1-acyl-sn-glycerol-3-phosphate acyltransferase
MRKKIKTIYYKDELSDEFSDVSITPKTIDGSYVYLRDSFLGKCIHFFCYCVIAKPLAYVFLKLAFHHKIIGKYKLKSCKKGYFLYGNHTNAIADALIPTFVSFPKSVSVIVHPNNVSMPVLGKITPYLGALPLPDDREAMKHFADAIQTRVSENKCVMIYPEAHIWPYYTDIRPFGNASFHYPVSLNAPVYCFTNTYQKRKHGSRPRIVTYIDGPFFADESLSKKSQREALRNQVYTAMKQRAEENTVTLIQYIKQEKTDD